jgi:hypothetical protein
MTTDTVHSDPDACWEITEITLVVGPVSPAESTLLAICLLSRVAAWLNHNELLGNARENIWITRVAKTV